MKRTLTSVVLLVLALLGFTSISDAQKSSNQVLEIVSLTKKLTCPTDQNPNQKGADRQGELWRTSWTAFAQATKDFLDNELRVHPDRPEFPQAGRQHLSVGEVIDSSLPVMKQFNGSLVFKARLVSINTTSSDLMKGQPFKLELEMLEAGVKGWLVKPVHVYPKVSHLDKWRAIPPGGTVTFKSKLSGIAALGMGGKYFCVVLLSDAEPIEE